jgi:ribose 5-phosphate isomerase
VLSSSVIGIGTGETVLLVWVSSGVPQRIEQINWI